ncbi:hypothetical protein [Streptomyces sp. BE230]|uniref:hypothetical protein n=1 Tax=Streptomyces sp. BE230 TaxID=3002526 RepID=UPI002ECFBD61|nr:hypothetical protein [Streptomyces sp. BE230]
MNRSLPRTATALAIGLVVSLTTAASPASSHTVAWHNVSPAPSDGCVLFDVETAGGATWAVGMRSDATTRPFAPIAMRWTGSTWEAPPQPAEHGRLDDVAVGAPDEVWAVGTRNEPVGEDGWDHGRALLQHWDGSAWREAVLPFPEDAAYTSLSAVDVAADGSVWVYGGYAGTSGEYVTVLFRGDARGGDDWTLLPAETALTWVSELKAGPGGVAYAIGDGVSRFDGTTWTEQRLPSALDGALFDGIEVRAANDIWAVGHLPDELLWRRPVIVHFDGRVWRTVRTPAETGQLYDVTFDGAGRPVVVGETQNSGVNPSGSYVLTLNSRGVLSRSEEPPGAGYLYSATTDSAGRVWAVGGAAGAETGTSPSAYAGIRG